MSTPGELPVQLAAVSLALRIQMNISRKTRWEKRLGKQEERVNISFNILAIIPAHFHIADLVMFMMDLNFPLSRMWLRPYWAKKKRPLVALMS